MTVRPIEKRDYTAFRSMFTDYFNELDCEDDPECTFDEYLLPDFESGGFSVAVAEENGAVIGFVIYQIDELIGEWNFKEGWGDVREMFVAFEHRGRGIGSALLKYAEDALLNEGADGVYLLPVEEYEEYFLHRGYEDCGEVCKALTAKVFQKKL